MSTTSHRKTAVFPITQTNAGVSQCGSFTRSPAFRCATKLTIKIALKLPGNGKNSDSKCSHRRTQARQQRLRKENRHHSQRNLQRPRRGNKGSSPQASRGDTCKLLKINE